MTFDEPLWLLVGAAIPLIWWLHRHVDAPQEVRVASVEALRGAAANAPAERPQRRMDRSLLALLAGVMSLTLAAAGARVGTTTASVLVVVDGSASGAAFDVDGEPLRTTALHGALLAITAAAPGASVDVMPLGANEPSARVPAADLLGDDALAAIPPAGLSSDGLPRSLSAALQFAGTHGYAGLLLVTERNLAPQPGVVLAGPRARPGRDTGVVGAVLDGDRVLVSVLRDAAGPIELRARSDAFDVRVPIPALAAGADARIEVEAPAPARDHGARYSIESGDAFAENDWLEVERRGGARTVRLGGPGASSAGRLRALLATLRVEVDSSALADVDVEILVGGGPAPHPGTSPPRLHLAVAPGHAPSITVARAVDRLSGAAVATDGVLADAQPSSSVQLAVTGRVDVEGEHAQGAWRSAAGRVAVALSRQVLVAIDAEYAASNWATDASFPVLLLASLDHLTGGPDRLEAVRSLPASEGVRDGAPPPPADVAEVRAIVRPPALGDGTQPLGATLALVGAGLLATSVTISAWKRERFSGLTRTPGTAG